MSAKILEMPKRNQSYWDALFDKFCKDIDKVVAAHYPAESPSAHVLPTDEHAPEPTMDDGYYEDDEPMWSDTQTRLEQMNSIKGR